MASPRQAGLRRAYGELRNVLYVVGAIILVWALVLAAIWMFTGSGDEVPAGNLAGTTSPQSPGIFPNTTGQQQPGVFNPTGTQQQP